MAKKTKAVAKRGSTAVASVKEAMQQEVAELNQRIKQPGGAVIKVTKRKTFVFPNGEETADPIRLVILDFVSRNTWYKGKFNEKNPTPPHCFAIGKVISDLAPSKNSPEPQSDACEGCKQNEFPDSGGGKPCKNTRLLAVMAPDSEKADDPILLLSVSPTALKSFDGYVSTVQRMFGVPPVGVVTEVSFDPTSEYQSLRFAKPEKNENVEYFWERREEAQQILMQEPDLSRLAAGKGATRRGRTVR